MAVQLNTQVTNTTTSVAQTVATKPQVKAEPASIMPQTAEKVETVEVKKTEIKKQK